MNDPLLASHNKKLGRNQSDKTIARNFGLRLREMRLRAGLSQEKLAALIGTNTPQVSRWEHGRYVPSMLSVMKIAKAFEVEWTTLMT